MKRTVLFSCLTILALHMQAVSAFPAETEFDAFIGKFDYETRDAMKIDSKGLVSLLTRKKAVLLDIRFKEEIAVWHMDFGLKIPINELPTRLKEIPRDKIVVAACPHKDRSAVAMAYLRSKGYDAKYLTDGLIGLAEQLRGENAKEFLEELESTHKK